MRDFNSGPRAMPKHLNTYIVVKNVGNRLSPTWSVIVKVDIPHVVFKNIMMRLYLVESSVGTKETVQTVVRWK